MRALILILMLGIFLAMPVLAYDYSPEEVHNATTDYEFIEKISDAPEEASFYLDKRISYGDLLIFSVLFLFLLIKIFEICWNFIFPKSIKALTQNDLGATFLLCFWCLAWVYRLSLYSVRFHEFPERKRPYQTN
jgi:hypothetical protein